NELIPILIKAPADKATREKWLEQLFDAVLDDGVQYLSPVEERWGEICVFPELTNKWTDRILPLLKDGWRNQNVSNYVVMTDICLSCLLESGRYIELEHLLSLRSADFWSYDKYWAEALKHQGLVDRAISFAESRLKDDYDRIDILEFCESVLLNADRKEEAYLRYGIMIRTGTTYLAQYRSILKKYPERDPRKILMDLIESSGDKAAWFSSARQAGFLNIAEECAFSGIVNPKTLIRAARDAKESDPRFTSRIAYRAIDNMLQGHGYEMTTSDLTQAFDHLMTAAKNLQIMSQTIKELQMLLDQKSSNYIKETQEILANLLKNFQESQV
ncbi:MAG: hypothetical protein U9Q38_09500, partial [Thermodesulfobacteriota bacterium]|nr:hypothetical protein [Thermodesulfobacteriota bacterium]